MLILILRFPSYKGPFFDISLVFISLSLSVMEFYEIEFLLNSII